MQTHGRIYRKKSGNARTPTAYVHAVIQRNIQPLGYCIIGL